ncbi:MAG: type I methionyl aminopeptidase [Bacteroidetes bacterium]|nr:type I methionyl aminopeptidase [Bacteroidota bacterium]
MNSPAIKIPSAINLIEESCRIVVGALLEVRKNVRVGITTDELDAIAEDYIRSQNGEPAFKGYIVDGKSFPSSLCISINDEVVHGLPSSRELEEGQIVSIDCGVKKNGYFGDSAATFPVGVVSAEKQLLLDVTYESLMLGVSQAVANNKVYDISRAVQSHVEKNGFSVVRELVGHGVGKKLHEDPVIPNFVPPLLHRSRFPNDRLVKGKALAIEPMVNAGVFRVKTASDGWTVLTSDGRPSAHFEHTVIVEDKQPIILTLLS